MLRIFLSMKKKKKIITKSKSKFFGVIIMLNIKLTMMKIKHYQLKNILIKLIKLFKRYHK